MNKLLKASVCFLMLSAAALLKANSVTVFSSGVSLPEDIIVAPAGFGLGAGTLLVVNDQTGNGGQPPGDILAISSGGGSASSILGGGAISNAFLYGAAAFPSSSASLAGQVLAFGLTETSTGPFGAIFSLSSANSTPTLLYRSTNEFEYQIPVVAPTGFGSVGGSMLVTAFNSNESGSIVTAVSPTGAVSTFATLPAGQRFSGATFAPAGFVPGATGSVLLISDDNNGNIYWVDSSGNVHLFTTVPLLAGQVGLRSMAFAPAGYGAYGGDLFISVASEDGGGGTFGSVDVFNSSGALVSILSQGDVSAPFDPRGLYFDSSSDLLVGDSDPAIYSVAPDAFTATAPEPGTIGLMAGALVMLSTAGMRMRKRVA